MNKYYALAIGTGFVWLFLTIWMFTLSESDPRLPWMVFPYIILFLLGTFFTGKGDDAGRAADGPEKSVDETEDPAQYALPEDKDWLRTAGGLLLPEGWKLEQHPDLVGHTSEGQPVIGLPDGRVWYPSKEELKEIPPCYCGNPWSGCDMPEDDPANKPVIDPVVEAIKRREQQIKEAALKRDLERDNMTNQIVANYVDEFRKSYRYRVDMYRARDDEFDEAVLRDHAAIIEKLELRGFTAKYEETDSAYTWTQTLTLTHYQGVPLP